MSQLGDSPARVASTVANEAGDGPWRSANGADG
jgi:hypothetical protein